MNSSINADIAAVQSITSVPTIMRVIAQSTGLRWVCISRVTETSWTMCAVHDELAFGLVPGDEIEIANTFCDKVRHSNVGVVIDDVSNDPNYHDHPIPSLFGFESYFSIPVYRKDGEFFGTLCGLDPKPKSLTPPKTLDSLKLFAELLSKQIDAEIGFSETKEALKIEKDVAEMREQFIAILGHDLRTPLSSIMTGADVIERLSDDERILRVTARISRSGLRISSLIDTVMDFTRSKMDGALASDLKWETELQAALLHVVAELRSAYPDSEIQSIISLEGAVYCDTRRVAQLASNLVVNAIIHGAPEKAVIVKATLVQGSFCLTVSNSGKAITPEFAKRLFQPFWRGDQKNTAGGLGLGLYIASEIAKSHRGNLAVESDNVQTSFIFTIPVNRTDA